MKKIGYCTARYRTMPRRLSILTFAALLLGVAAQGFAPRAQAQGAGAPTGPAAVSPLSPSVPPEIVKPMVGAGAADDAEAVFKKLDVGKRGYLTPSETRDLLGFDAAFKTADSEGNGRLTLAQFKKAWTLYKAKSPR